MGTKLKNNDSSWINHNKTLNTVHLLHIFAVRVLCLILNFRIQDWEPVLCNSGLNEGYEVATSDSRMMEERNWD